MPKIDPYEGLTPDKWPARTRELIDAHPLDPGEVVDVVLDAWRRILTTRIAGELEIGVDVQPSPQMMGNFLESVMVVDFSDRYPQVWREQRAKYEKDLVCIPDDLYSTEIKTSSDGTSVFGNRSYAQPALPGTKDRDGYFITVNFESFKIRTPPEVSFIKMGWLNHDDWIPQKSPTGQQARIELNARKFKLLEIYRSRLS